MSPALGYLKKFSANSLNSFLLTLPESLLCLLGEHCRLTQLLHFPAHTFSTPGSRQTLRCLLTGTDHWSMSPTGTEFAGGCALQAGSAWDKGLVAMIKETSTTFQEILKVQRPKNLFYKEKYEIQCHQPQTEGGVSWE